jgi:N-glycosylase/DNA lyase
LSDSDIIVKNLEIGYGMTEKDRNPAAMLARRGRLAAPGFDLGISMDCGQIFGWVKDDGAYAGIIAGKPVSIRQEGETVSFTAGAGLPKRDIKRYLGLDEDLDEIIASVERDDYMKRVVAAARGLRLLKQDPWPCLCSYILSSNNRVDRIDRLVKEIGARYGNRHEIDGIEVFSLPAPEDLAACGETDMRACGVGFRAPYLMKAGEMVAGGMVDLEAIDRMPYDDAREVLMTIPGVGGKIADCVLLFAFCKYEAFPVDVWIKRAMQQAYFDSKETKAEVIRKFGQDYFGRYAGYAQEYIYYHIRNQ